MKAQNGKVYKNIITGEILGNELWLGCNDTAENYIEVDKPIEVEPIEPVTPPEITITADATFNKIGVVDDGTTLGTDTEENEVGEVLKEEADINTEVTAGN